MAKMKDWTSQLTGETRASYVQMMQEIPLISYEMNPDELRYTYGVSRKKAGFKLIKSLIICVTATAFIDLVFLLYILLFEPDAILYSYKVLGPISILILALLIPLSFVQFFQTKRRPEVVVTYSGATFLGSFYPFRTGDRHLGSASYIEAGENSPPLLRLNFRVITTLRGGASIEIPKLNDDYLIEVPLRPEHVEKITEIIQTLLPSSDSDNSRHI